MADQYIPILVVFVLAGLVVGLLPLAGHVLGPKARTATKEQPFECGNPPSGSAWEKRFSVKFYLVAILFILFDVEVVFMYPWAVIFRRLGWFGFAEMVVFAGILGIGLVYVWRKGALEWE